VPRFGFLPWMLMMKKTLLNGLLVTETTRNDCCTFGSCRRGPLGRRADVGSRAAVPSQPAHSFERSSRGWQVSAKSLGQEHRQLGGHDGGRTFLKSHNRLCEGGCDDLLHWAGRIATFCLDLYR